MCRIWSEVMDLIEANPREKRLLPRMKRLKFKWEDYHQQQLADVEEDDDDWDDDWSEEDEEGVEIIYKP